MFCLVSAVKNVLAFKALGIRVRFKYVGLRTVLNKKRNLFWSMEILRSL